TPKKIFEHVAAIRRETEIPIVVMSYYNPIVQFGVDRFMNRFADCGGDGLIIPDLPIEEADEVVHAARAVGIDTIFLIAPTTPDDRIAKICAYSTGFVYLVSLLGVTGVRERISGMVQMLIQRVVEKRPDIPVAVGFGISKLEHVRELVANGAQGVIVGSAIVELIAAHKDEPERMISALETFCAEIKAATRA
ncbi:MAG: tryptophan synthase subunit alpha, partial [Methanophagales archaeon ANME-1-THS]